jgi:hypothetical protein
LGADFASQTTAPPPPPGFEMVSTPLKLQNPISYLRRALYILYVFDSKLNY